MIVPFEKEHLMLKEQQAQRSEARTSLICLRNRKNSSVYNSVKDNKGKKNRDEAAKRSKDQMIKGTIIHDKKLGLYSKSNGKLLRQE